MTLLFHVFPVASGPRSRPAQMSGVVVFIAATVLGCTPAPRDFNAAGGGNIAGSGGMAGMGGAGGSGGVEPIPMPRARWELATCDEFVSVQGVPRCPMQPRAQQYDREISGRDPDRPCKQTPPIL